MHVWALGLSCEPGGFGAARAGAWNVCEVVLGVRALEKSRARQARCSDKHLHGVCRETLVGMPGSTTFDGEVVVSSTRTGQQKRETSDTEDLKKSRISAVDPLEALVVCSQETKVGRVHEE